MTPDDEIIVVDSASRDAGAVERVAIAADARFLRLQRAGSARARNFGAAAARGSWLAFTDDDAVVEPTWIEALARGLADSAVSAVVGPVFELGRTPETLLLSYSAFDPRVRASFERTQAGWFESVRLGAIGSGANLAVRRSAFEREGPFRESLGCGAPIMGDENYFLLSLVERGHRVVNEPDARVHHPAQSEMRRRQLRNDRAAYFLYVALTRPGLRASCASMLLRKLTRRGARGSARQPGRDLSVGASLLHTPTQVLQSLRIDRE